jgi:hypothetical protein
MTLVVNPVAEDVTRSLSGQTARRVLTIGAPASAALLVWSAVVALAVLAGFPAAVRAPLVISFACLAPGLALVRHLRLDSPLMELVCSLLLSVSLVILVSWGMVATHNWAPFGFFWALLLLTVADALVALLVGDRRRRTAG